MTLTRTLAAAACAVLLGSLATGSAGTAAVAAPAAACAMTVGSITSGGDIGYSDVTASAPVTARQGTGVHIFTPGIAKMSSTWTRNVGEPDGPMTNVIEVCVNALRKKVERPGQRQLIHTVRGVGYALRDR